MKSKFHRFVLTITIPFILSFNAASASNGGSGVGGTESVMKAYSFCSNVFNILDVGLEEANEEIALSDKVLILVASYKAAQNSASLLPPNLANMRLRNALEWSLDQSLILAPVDYTTLENVDHQLKSNYRFLMQNIRYLKKLAQTETLALYSEGAFASAMPSSVLASIEVNLAMVQEQNKIMLCLYFGNVDECLTNDGQLVSFKVRFNSEGVVVPAMANARAGIQMLAVQAHSTLKALKADEMTIPVFQGQISKLEGQKVRLANILGQSGDIDLYQLSSRVTAFERLNRMLELQTCSL